MCDSACTHTQSPCRSSVWPQHLVSDRKWVLSHIRTMATVSIQLRPLAHLKPASQKTLTAPWEASTNRCTLHWPLWRCPCILLLSASSLSLRLCLLSLLLLSLTFFLLFSLTFFHTLSPWYFSHLTCQNKQVSTMKNLQIKPRSGGSTSEFAEIKDTLQAQAVNRKKYFNKMVTV